jgi:peptidoglycan/xylan/chitin deacetylase (PgdA/CDA1 family)
MAAKLYLSEIGLALVKKGYFVISLDFELHWGVRDKKTIQEYGENILGVRKAIPGMLDLFDKFDVNVSFATVGLLFHNNKRQLLSNLPQQKVNYKNKQLSPYSGYIDSIGENEREDPYHYADELIRCIQSYNRHEICCHTFSHYYCLEDGQTAADFEADLKACQKVAAQYGLELKSLVFPRNQYNPDYLKICVENGIIAYRGNPDSWIYSAKNEEEESLLRRSVRFGDTFLNISGYHTFDTEEISADLPVNIPASRFLRPFSKKLSFLESLKINRIKQEMTYAAANQRMYHLWWHPHNFGVHTDENLANLQEILQHYNELKIKYSFESITMKDLAFLIINREV